MARITQAELARRLGVSRAGVAKAKKAGRITVGPDGLVDEDEALRAWKENTRAAMKAGATAEAGDTEKRPRGGQAKYSSARARREHARAAREELALARERGEVAETASIRAGAADLGVWLRTILEGLPDRIAGDLAMQPPEVVAARLTDAIEGVLTEFVGRIGREVARLGAV